MGFGVLFFIALYSSFVFDLRSLSPYVIFQAWLSFAGAILVVWGVVRVLTGAKGWRIGQPTINFVVGIIGATIALLALVKQK